MRRMFRTLAPERLGLLNCKYRPGAAYYRSRMRGSATIQRPRNAEDLANGKLAEAWVDVQVLAKAVGTHEVRVCGKPSMKSDMYEWKGVSPPGSSWASARGMSGDPRLRA